jgi:hypothetical protein
MVVIPLVLSGSTGDGKFLKQSLQIHFCCCHLDTVARPIARRLIIVEAIEKVSFVVIVSQITASHFSRLNACHRHNARLGNGLFL